MSVIYNEFSPDDRLILDQLIDFLIEKDLAFLSDTPELFPPISDSWSMPSTITNAIVCVSNNTISYMKDIVHELENLGCQSVELRLLDNTDFKYILNILNLFNDSIIGAIELITSLEYEDSPIATNTRELIKNYGRLKRITIYDAGRYEKQLVNNTITEYINSSYRLDLCGIISHKSLIFSIPFYTESLHYNTCMNRKICVDSKGDIKNCIASRTIFGNIKDVDLSSVTKDPRFRAYNLISKDLVDVCKDCEFRYACMDCRIYTDDNKNILSRPSKCLYNPYIGKWKNEEGYVAVTDYKTPFANNIY